MSGKPPFLQGQQAFRDGVFIAENPHDAEAPATGDDYPGAYANWRAGWITERMLQKDRKGTAKK